MFFLYGRPRFAAHAISAGLTRGSGWRSLPTMKITKLLVLSLCVAGLGACEKSSADTANPEEATEAATEEAAPAEEMEAPAEEPAEEEAAEEDAAAEEGEGEGEGEAE